MTKKKNEADDQWGATFQIQTVEADKFSDNNKQQCLKYKEPTCHLCFVPTLFLQLITKHCHHPRFRRHSSPPLKKPFIIDSELDMMDFKLFSKKESSSSSSPANVATRKLGSDGLPISKRTITIAVDTGATFGPDKIPLIYATPNAPAEVVATITFETDRDCTADALDVRFVGLSRGDRVNSKETPTSYFIAIEKMKYVSLYIV